MAKAKNSPLLVGRQAAVLSGIVILAGASSVAEAVKCEVALRFPPTFPI
jgi:hypothetical protein